MISTISQWIGCAGVLAGYWLYLRRPLSGAAVSFVGGLGLTVWLFTLDEWNFGALATQVGCLAINGRAAFLAFRQLRRF